ncbi:hypothetical protein ACFQ41_04800 [Lacticaseibacillus suilingensis]|uniref:Uncharacterized protein n=1 Tax=Lacticaseibacillus suilingensis TaxID=2799577 RepID=A0ABW4BGI1_9LACO|nr:hypothetical protein [Lacticaseibacillus suilingensis]
MTEGEYLTVYAMLWQPEEENVDTYNMVNVVIKRSDFKRWIAGDKGGAVLTVDDGKWLAVKLENIVQMSAAEPK